MKNSLIYLSLLAILFTSACKKDENGTSSFENRSTSAADYSQSSLPVVAVTANITTNTTWSASNVYELTGVITVSNGATLTIQPGTYIKSSVNTAGVQNGVLVISKTGLINAVGTAASPIVFTSRYLLDGNASTVGKPGDFGGVIILGNAITNAPGGTKLIEGLPTGNANYVYGGTNNADDRGDFKYVRIEYAGFQLAENIEVNSLTLGAVGSGTQIDHVQVSYGLDDGFEFFGGTVSPTYLVALGSDDDQFDFDNGYTGTIRYAIAVADKNATHSVSGTASDSNGIESDNNAPAESATFALLPKTHPKLGNFSIIGTVDNAGVSGLGYRNAIRERRGSEISISNSLITGYPRGIVFDADANENVIDTLNNVSVHGFGTGNAIVSSGTYTTLGTILTSVATTAPTFSMVQPFFNVGTVNFTTSSGARGAITSNSGNWIATWTKFVY